MTITDTAIDEHPAPFSEPVLQRLRELIYRESEGRGIDLPRVLDPFAGTGLIHSLDDIAETVGIEIEPEWAARDPRTLCANSRAMPLPPNSVHIVATSPCYGNRLADTYDGKGKCRACSGDGVVENPTYASAPTWSDDPPTIECPRCGGEGHDTSKRLTYAIALKREPSDDSAGKMQWGPAYRDLHQAVYAECARVMLPPPDIDYAIGWPAFINVSDHPRDKAMVHVVDWHVEALRQAGFWIDEIIRIGTRRWGYGRNGQVRADGERIIVARRG